MAYFRIKQQGQPTKYIKSVDGANGTLEFTENMQEAMYRDMGFFADSEFGFIKFHFTENYPELENMDIYDGYSDEGDETCTTATYGTYGIGVGNIDVVVEEAPQAPAYIGDEEADEAPFEEEAAQYAPAFERVTLGANCDDLSPVYGGMTIAAP